MKRINKKLQFNAQTVRALVAQDLEQAAGGTSIIMPGTAGPIRCTQRGSGCSNNDTFQDCMPGPIQQPGGGGYYISRYLC